MSRLLRLAVISGLALSVLAVLGSSPAGAVATASMVNNNNGSLTITYAGNVTGPSGYDVLFILRSQGSTCPTSPVGQNAYLYMLTANPLGGQTPNMTGSPMTVTAGTTVMGANGPQGIALPAGFYQACLYTQDIGANSYTAVSGFAATMGNPPSPTTTAAPTTTTTAASGATTTTAAAADAAGGDPVAPAFTG